MSWDSESVTPSLAELEAGYAAMAQDEEHEAGALEWAEAIIGDYADVKRQDSGDNF